MVTRRALLGAAVAVPLSLGSSAAAAPGPLHQASPCHAKAQTAPGSQPATLGIARPGEDRWGSALDAFREALAEVRAVEAATAGRSAAEEEALLPAQDAACAAMEAALGRAMLAPAPDLAALAVKLELLFAHEVEPDAVNETALAAVLGDSRRLLVGR